MRFPFCWIDFNSGKCTVKVFQHILLFGKKIKTYDGVRIESVLSIAVGVVHRSPKKITIFMERQ